MRSTFFSRHALAILCLVFFLIPFGLRGARLSLSRMKNDVKDWLPEDFKETAELKWFARHFAGERFVVATWPGCTENDPRFDRMLRRLEEECEPLKLPPLSEDPVAREDELARRLGAELGLFFTGDYYENWGGRGEKWLLGGKDRWYYVTPDGLLYRWDTGDNVVGRGVRTLRRRQTGEKVRGILVEQWQPANGARYFEDPRRLTARLFRTVLTGPAAVERMAVKNGAVWPRGRELSDEEKQVQARRNATQRLTGSL